MNCFNGSKYLGPSIASVLAQDFPDWELIFWDNQSTDDSVSIARGFADPRIKIHHAAAHVPLGAARNAAVALATGQYITFLDTDDLWHPGKLRRQVAHLERHPTVALLYTNLAVFTDEQDWRKRPPQLRGRQPAGRIFGDLLRRYPINLQTVMVNAAVLRRMPELFAPDFHVAEEFDLFLRLLYRSEAGYMPEVLVGYRLHPQQASRTKIGLYAIETEAILAKLQKLYPESTEEYRVQYTFFAGKVAYYRARAALSAGDRALARRELGPWKWRHWRFLALYGLLWMPGRVFAMVHRLAGRYH